MSLIHTMRKILLLSVLLFISFTVKSQFISISTGIASDANNAGNAFRSIPLEFQWYPFSDAKISFVIDYDLGLLKKSTGDAYTTNPALPGKVQLNEEMRTNLVTFGASFSVELFRTKSNNLAELSLMPLGYCFQHFKTSYKNFDKENYEILNQDVDRNSNGFVIAFGLKYQFNKNKIISFNIQPPLLKSRESDFNYQYIAPARFMFGYQYKYKKNK